MGLEELKKKFILDETEVRGRLEELITKALNYCRVDSKGRIHFERKTLSGMERVKVALAARGIASELDSSFSAEMSIDELSRSTGLPENSVRARCAELAAHNYIEAPTKGVFKVVFAKVEELLDSIRNKSTIPEE